ncbi:MAG: sulfatase-like hydrolase/transferase [Candidatus Natronoplasma sp.]
MLDQKKKINEGDWDYLLILDACRYDHFKVLYPDFLSGRLKKANSPVKCLKGVATSEWCKSVFTKRYDDVIYVSTTPHVNSFSEVNGFKASDHFFKVVDVWNNRWDDEKGTVYPDEVNQAIIDTKIKHPKKRIIAHYMQPHFPYLTLDNPFNPKNKEPTSHDNIKRTLRNFFGSKTRRILGGKMTRKLLRTLNLPPINPMDETLRKIGHDGLIEAYKENLKAVLKSLNKLSDELSGEVIVSSDHGEYLGENGFYGHSYLPQHRALNEVPWFEMETF